MQLAAPIWQMWAVYAVILAAVVVYAGDWLSMELTSAGVLAVLLLLFHIWPIADPARALDARALLAGFGDPALIAVLGLIVVGQGLVQTDAIEMLVQPLAERLRSRRMVLALALFVTIALVSAFINNTPVVVIFIPIAVSLTARLDLPAGRYMMAISFAAILGGMTTLLGSSTNLLASGVLQERGLPPVGIFEFTVPGLVLAAIGILYLLYVAPRLLPDRDAAAGAVVGGGDGRQFIAQIEVVPGDRLIGERAVAGRFAALPGMTVRMFQRGAGNIMPPFDNVAIEAGDVLVVAATRRALTEALANTPSLLPSDFRLEPSGRMLVEAMVAPASRMAGRNLRQIGFHHQTDCAVLALQRRPRMVREHLDRIPLDMGDVALLLGREADVRALRDNHDVIMLEWSTHEVAARQHARRAGLVFAAVVALAASELLPIVIPAVVGAVAMLAAGCLNVRQAGRALDRRLIMLIPAALAMGQALQATGGAAYIAHHLVAGFAGFGPEVTLSALFLTVALMTNLISNNATAVLFTPIAIGVAGELGVAAMPFVHAVILAANCSFATPIGYQTNLLVMGPGHYTFGDFLRAGSPLVLLLWLAFSLFAPWYYGL
jgi:di/tricarboxylate transporter